MLVKVKARWTSPEDEEAQQLGLHTSNKVIWKSVRINPDRIAFIEEYEGFCFGAFSALPEDGLITNVPFKNYEFFNK